ncbi:MAG: hypothetical protein ACOX8O_05740 [Christensenellales bacterium]|jgi:predicted permease|nr:hypothetical protein [Clostridiales bacterium]
MRWILNAGASGAIGLALLASAAACAFGARLFCRRRGYDEEKTADAVFRAKVLAIILAVAGTALVTDVVRF